MKINHAKQTRVYVSNTEFTYDIPAHDSTIRSMCLSLDEEMYFTGSAEGDIKVLLFLSHKI